LATRFKFFLAFENTICDNGYITEKFFDTIFYDIIVVTLGGSDYTQFIPKSGFIDGFKDFKTPQHLANYLTYLSLNDTAYNEYFKWKRFMKQLKRNENLLEKNENDKMEKTLVYDKEKVVLAGFLCEMCIQLNLERVTGHLENYATISSLNEWYGINQTCYGKTSDNFEFTKGLNVKHSVFMSPEDSENHTTSEFQILILVVVLFLILNRVYYSLKLCLSNFFFYCFILKYFIH
jgi:hypothetical protein